MMICRQVTVTGSLDGPVTWQARRGLWLPGPGQSAVVAGPQLAESARGLVYGRPGPGLARLRVRLSHRAGGLTAYGVGATLCLKRHGHVSSFMCIPLCVSGIWVSS
jgi:hypothetical protein